MRGLIKLVRLVLQRFYQHRAKWNFKGSGKRLIVKPEIFAHKSIIKHLKLFFQSSKKPLGNLS